MFMRSEKIQFERIPPRNRILSRFARDESGALVVFALYAFLIMLIVGGIGVDLMRFERDRAKLQNTLDRAVLAAADLDQNLSPSAVVTDYFDKSGLSEYLTSVTVDQGLSYRTVSGSATAEVETQFMHMTGVETLTAPAASTAEERIDGVEISLVLDVSGSMNRNSKLSNLKVAARDFIDEMVQNTEDGKLSISIIPYATQVSAPTELFQYFNTSNEHSYSNCINFESADFNETGMDPNHAWERTMHFDVFTYSEGRYESPAEFVDFPVCENHGAREMMIMQKDANTLKTFISNLHARGNTSIDVGMKWGTALIDPEMNPVIVSMINDGNVNGDFAARPLEYDDSDILKVIVLMTDGQNTDQYYIDEDYREGASDIWWNADEEKYSVYDTDSDSYYWPHDDDWHDHAYGNQGAVTYCKKYRWNGKCKKWGTIPPEPGEALVLDYPELWAYTSVAENVVKNYEPWSGSSWNDWYYGVYSSVGHGTKNSRTKDICDAVKEQQVIVYTIGFEAPSGGVAVLQNCASSASHFFDVDGLEISDAFSSIASSIRKLRLTQ